MRTLASSLSSLFFLATVNAALAQQPLSAYETPIPPEGDVIPQSKVLSLDPSLDRIVSADAKVYVVKGGNSFGITEGPAWIPDGQSGYLLFSDVVANVIYKWAPATGQLSVFLNNSGYTGSLADASHAGFLARSGPFYVFDFGSVGIGRDLQGRIVVSAGGDREIFRLNADGTRTVLASKYEGKPFDRLNKIAIKSDGTIYFTDVCFADTPCPQVYRQALYMLKEGKVRLLIKHGHGVELSPDEKVLYITGFDTKAYDSRATRPLGEYVMRYDIQSDDTVANERMFIPAPEGGGGPDGITVDREGNVYGGGTGGLWITSPAGKHIGTIVLPELATNVTFGDPDLKTLYILDRRNLLKIRLKVSGMVLPTRLTGRPAKN